MDPDEFKYMYDMETIHWWYTSRRALAVHIIKSFKMSNPKILDVGVGTGYNLIAFSKLGGVCGIDSSEIAINFCHSRGLKNIIKCQAQSIEYKDKTFDIVTCLDLLEHVPDAQEVLSEMKRVLKDNGKIIIMVPAFKILWSQHDEALFHLRRYEKKSLLCDIFEAHLETERINFFFFTSSFVVFPIRIIRKFLPLKIKAKSDTTTIPPAFLNTLLKFIFSIEIKIADKINLPFGTTIYAVVSKEG